MYKIAVCDDNKIICLEIENILLNLQKENENEIDVDIFFKGENQQACHDRDAAGIAWRHRHCAG